MEQTELTYPIILGGFAVLQAVLAFWVLVRSRSWPLAGATMFLPLALPALWRLVDLSAQPWYVFVLLLASSLLPFAAVLWRLREELRDNQVGGVVTYLAVVAGVAYFLRFIPADEMPWAVIYTMEFFAGLGAANAVDLALVMRYRVGR